jgi:hypothetical protein
MDKVMICPLMGGKCIEDGVVDKESGDIHACRFWVTVHGKNPNRPDEDMESHDCSFAISPLIEINTANEVRKLSAEIAELRKEEAGIGKQITGSILMALDAQGKLGK